MLTWNAGARALFGYASDEIAGGASPSCYQGGLSLLGKPEPHGDALQWGRHESTGPILRKDGTA